MFERTRKGENALLIQPYRPGLQDPTLLEEFIELARSAGATVVGTINARVERASPSHYIGSGKLIEVKDACEAMGADLVLVNHALTPGQERNLEKDLGRRVVDRSGLILDIFAQRAASHEGKLQVELAQLKHMATRLIRGWSHLERQRGGSIGLRGPGETQLETDRRLLQKRVEVLQSRLDKIEVQRTQMRRARLRNAIPRVSLVGYTNAGKSTLFNSLSGSGVYVADKLFATLDPTVRRLDIAGGSSLVLSDTVGFVRDLPHDLIAAFRSTLSEARDADLLLHVVDAADPLRDERIEQVDAVLNEIGAGDIPQILIFNKIDRLDATSARHDIPGQGFERFWLSAKTGDGVEAFRHALGNRFSQQRYLTTLQLPPDQGRLYSRLYAAGAIVAEQSDEHGWQLEIDMPLAQAERMAVEPGGHFLQEALLVDLVDPSYNP